MVRLIEFQAEWCGPCKTQEPIVDELADDRDDFVLEKVDIDEQKDIVNKYSVRSVPTIVIENDDGDVVTQFTGVTSREDIEDALDEA